MPRQLSSTSVFFPSDPKTLWLRPMPGGDRATRAVITGQRVFQVVAAVLTWRTFRRSGGDRPAVPAAAILLLAIDLVTGIRQQIMDLDELLNALRGRAVDEEWSLSEQELRRMALQLHEQPEGVPDPGMEPGLTPFGARFVVRSLVGTPTTSEQALAAARALELDGRAPA